MDLAQHQGQNHDEELETCIRTIVQIYACKSDDVRQAVRNMTRSFIQIFRSRGRTAEPLTSVRDGFALWIVGRLERRQLHFCLGPLFSPHTSPERAGLLKKIIDLSTDRDGELITSELDIFFFFREPIAGSVCALRSLKKALSKIPNNDEPFLAVYRAIVAIRKDRLDSKTGTGGRSEPYCFSGAVIVTDLKPSIQEALFMPTDLQKFVDQQQLLTGTSAEREDREEAQENVEEFISKDSHEFHQAEVGRGDLAPASSISAPSLLNLSFFAPNS
jgi:hypothetical protein